MKFARPMIPSLRSNSVSHTRPRIISSEISQPKNSILSIKETIAEAKKTVKFADKSQSVEDEIEFPPTVSSIISSDMTSEVHVSGIARRSPYKTIQQYANNRKGNLSIWKSLTL